MIVPRGDRNVIVCVNGVVDAPSESVSQEQNMYLPRLSHVRACLMVSAVHVLPVEPAEGGAGIGRRRRGTRRSAAWPVLHVEPCRHGTGARDGEHAADLGRRIDRAIRVGNAERRAVGEGRPGTGQQDGEGGADRKGQRSTAAPAVLVLGALELRHTCPPVAVKCFLAGAVDRKPGRRVELVVQAVVGSSPIAHPS